MTSAVALPLFAFTLAATVLTITPGVDTALVVRSAAAQGPRAGAAAAVGICAGLLAWGAGAALGLNALLFSSPAAFTLLTWAGAAYLAVLGIRLVVRPRTAVEPAAIGETPGGPGGALRNGFFTNVLNPKVGVFYVTFLPQFIPPGADVATFSLLLACIHVLLTSMWFAALIGLTVPLGRLLRRPSVIRTLDRLTGCVFIAFGAKLALTQRP